MNSAFKIAVFCVASVILSCECALAAAYISDTDFTTAVKLTGENEITQLDEGNGVALTRDGFLIISPGAAAALTAEDSVGEINVIPPVAFDFDNGELKSGAADFGDSTIVCEDSNCYLDGTSSPAALTFEKKDLNCGRMDITFSLCKENLLDSDFISIFEEGENPIFQISMVKRSSTQVYFSYLTADKIVRERTTLMNVGEWLDAEISLDFDAGKGSLYINNELLLDNVPILNTESKIEYMSFGENIDNLKISNTERIEDCTIDIGLEDTVNISGGGTVMLDPLIGLEFSGGRHEIDGKYCNLFVSQGEMLPCSGKIPFDTEDAETEITIKASCLISGEIKECEKTVAVKVSDDGEEYPPLAAAVAKYEINDDGSIMLSVNNGGDGKILFAAVFNGSRLQQLIPWEIPAGEKLQKRITADGIPSDAMRICLIDTDTMTDLIRQ